ncbi:hypothetical protein ACXJJ3_11050 [Kribbella sp. WER1]
MIFTRRFGALAARRRFPDAPELQELSTPVDLDAELAALTGEPTHPAHDRANDDDRRSAGESAA